MAPMKHISNFEFIHRLGKGGMGEVFLAKNKETQQEVAVKLIHVSPNFSEEILCRVSREAYILASLEHPNIVGFHEIGKKAGFIYIVLEYIANSSLERFTKTNLLPETLVWKMVLQICSALQSALSKGIIHRDIKPANILLTEENKIKLTDFGASKKIDDSIEITEVGTVVGTPCYMSPERFQGITEDFRSDIYSLGATIYELLTGSLIFKSDDIVEILNFHMDEKIILPSRQNKKISSNSELILGKMLQKKAVDRYHSYSELIDDIKLLLTDKSLKIASCADGEKIFQDFETLASHLNLEKEENEEEWLKDYKFPTIPLEYLEFEDKEKLDSNVGFSSSPTVHKKNISLKSEGNQDFDKEYSDSPTVTLNKSDILKNFESYQEQKKEEAEDKTVVKENFMSRSVENQLPCAGGKRNNIKKLLKGSGFTLNRIDILLLESLERDFISLKFRTEMLSEWWLNHRLPKEDLIDFLIRKEIFIQEARETFKLIYKRCLHYQNCRLLTAKGALSRLNLALNV